MKINVCIKLRKRNEEHATAVYLCEWVSLCLCVCVCVSVSVFVFVPVAAMLIIIVIIAPG